MGLMFGAGRAARPASVSVAILVLTSVVACTAQALVLDAVIRIPSPHRPIGMPLAQDNKLYVYCIGGNDDALYVLDCSTASIRGRILLDGSYFTSSFAHNWRRNRLYCRGALTDSNLYVVDCGFDSVVRRLRAGWFNSLAYNSTLDRIYAAADIGYVYDCASDSLVDTLPPPAGKEYATWDSVGNKVYAGGTMGSRRTYVIDCSIDSVVGWIDNGFYDGGYAVISPLHRRLYVAQDGDYVGGAVIDCEGDSLIAVLPLGCSVSPPVCNEAEGKVYWACEFDWTAGDEDSIGIVSLSGDSIIRMVTPPGVYERYVVACAFAPWSNRLYSIWGWRDSLGGVKHSYVCALDCATDSLVAWTRFSTRPGTSITCNPCDRKVYVACMGDTAIYVFRDELPGVSEQETLAKRIPHALAVRPNPASGFVDVHTAGPVELHSTDGRRVAVLAPGRNDITPTPAGVYFVVSRTGRIPVSAKLIIRR